MVGITVILCIFATQFSSKPLQTDLMRPKNKEIVTNAIDAIKGREANGGCETLSTKIIITKSV